MTVTSPDRLFDAVAANTTSSVIDTNTHSGIKVFRVAPSSSFAGSLTVQGQQHGDGDTWQRVRYWTNRPPSTDVDGPSSDVLYPTPSDYLLLFVVDPWPAMRLVATRTAGSLTVDFFSEVNRDFASLLLGSSSSVTIGDAITGDTLSITPGGGISIVSGDPNDAHVTAHLWSAEGPVSVEAPLPIQGPVGQGSAGSEDWNVTAGGRTLMLSAVIASTTGIYAANEVVGGLLAFSIVRGQRNGGVVESLTITDLSAQSLALDVLFFSQPVVLAADNAAHALTDGDVSPPVYLGSVSVAAADYIAQGSGRSTATKLGVGLALSLAQGGMLYVAIVTRGTPTYAKQPRISITLLQD